MGESLFLKTNFMNMSYNEIYFLICIFFKHFTNHISEFIVKKH